MRSTRYQRFNFDFVRRNFGSEVFGLYRSWNSLNYKSIRIECRLKFLKHCKNHMLFPSHLSRFSEGGIHLINHKSQHNLSKLLYSTKRRILNIESYDLHRVLQKIKQEISIISRSLSDLLPAYIWRDIYDSNYWFFEKYRQRIQLVYDKKILWMRKKKDLVRVDNIKNINYQAFYDKNKNTTAFISDELEVNNDDMVKYNINISPKKFKNELSRQAIRINDKWFINLSNHNIPSDVTKLLQLGEGFSFPFFKNKKESVIEYIKDFEGMGFRGNNSQKLKIRNTVVTQLHKFMNNEQQMDEVQRELMRLLKKTKSFCKDNSNIIFTKADKGNITVALDRDHYINSINILLQDKSTYETIQKNPVKNVEQRLNNILKRWHSLGFVSKQELCRLKNNDCSLPKAYGLPKVHKVGTPFRIIVSSINTTLNSFADYLQRILHKCLPPAQSHVKNSFELFNTLLGKKIPENHLLLSLDVKSLFTNIPSELVIEAIKNRWTYIEKVTKITKKEFIIAVKFILDSTFFTFDEVTYKQIFGSPMGSPLSPVLADLVMQDLENKAIDKLDFSFPFYYRYVDDILLLTPAEKVDSILNTFNNIHDRLKFTVEYEENRSISFLDLNLSVQNDVLYIDWHKKVTCSGRYLHYYSGHPICHKIGTIYGLIDRALLLSHPIFQQKNLEYVIKVLLDNDYPLELIFQKINHRIKDIIRRNKSKKPQQKVKENERKIVVLPYIRNISEKINLSIDKNIYMTGYRILNKLTGFIKRHKDANKFEVNNNIVYKILCNNCNASYVGQTKRQLKTRIDNEHSFDWKNVKILDFESNYFKRLIAEMIYIKSQDNGLNSVDDIECLDSSYFNLLTKIFKHKQ